MKNIKKDVVLNVKERKEKVENLLTKICKDFKINNYKTVVKKFLKSRKNHKK